MYDPDDDSTPLARRIACAVVLLVFVLLCAGLSYVLWGAVMVTQDSIVFLMPPPDPLCAGCQLPKRILHASGFCLDCLAADLARLRTLPSATRRTVAAVLFDAGAVTLAQVVNTP